MTKALEGMRVLDISLYEAGPACAQLLGWFGADVVQVSGVFESEPSGPPSSGLNEGALHLANNHNKRSLLLDLARPEGRNLLYRMLPNFDVVIENFALGVAEKLGVDYPTLKAHHPGVIYCTIKGFGLTGKYRNIRSLDSVAQAAGGAMSLTGEQNGPPLRAGYLVGDATSGLSAVAGVLAAYVQKLRTGEGQLVEVSMQEAILHLVRSTMVRRDAFANGIVARNGNRMTSPTDLYPCRGLGATDYIHLTSHWDRLFHRLCDAIGKPHLKTDPRFLTMDDRRSNGDEIWAEVAQWTVEHDKFEAMEILGQAGVPVSAVFDSHDIFENDHLRERGSIAEVDHPVRGKTRIAGVPVRLHGAPAEITAPAVLGEHTREILAAELGLAHDDIEKLMVAQIVADEVVPWTSG